MGHTRNTFKLLLSLLCSLAWLAGAPAAGAQDLNCDQLGTLPCGFDTGHVRIQKAPGVIRLQTRVSLQKLPGGEGTFPDLRVHLLRHPDDKVAQCTESFKGVQVRDTVLNLELGRRMSCELEEVLAENEALYLKLCIGPAGAGDDCLAPVALSAVPYAIKTSFASQATRARSATLAARAHYAHRLSADPEVYFRPRGVKGGLEPGFGYLSFRTPRVEETAGLYTRAEYAALAGSGFLTWTPARDGGNLSPSARYSTPRAWHLALGARHAGTGALEPLDHLTLGASEVHVRGQLWVAQGWAGRGKLTVDGGGLHLVGDSSTGLGGTLDVTRGDGLYITGGWEASEGGGSTVVALKVNGESTLSGDSTVAGTGTAKSHTTVDRGGLHVEAGELEITGGLQVTGGLEVDGDLSVQILGDGADKVVLGVAGDVHAEDELRLTPSPGAEAPALRVTATGEGDHVLLFPPASQYFDTLVIDTGLVVEGDAVLEGDVNITAGDLKQGAELCGPGLGRDENGNCVDVDECVSGTHDCVSAELCTNLHASEGRYSCQCPPRHVGIGRQPPGCVTDARRIFLSSKTWDGNLGGVLGAARKCQALADAAGLGGIWAAWLSSSRSDVKTRLPSARYVRAHDHKTVADSRDDLLDGTLAIAIDVDEKGNTHLDRETEVWTGSLADGTNEPGGMTCNDWTDGTSGYKARGGKASQKDPIEGKSNWSWATAPYCSEKHRLICFER